MLRAVAERFPLTPSGLTALVVCGLALRAGTARQDLVLTVGGTVGLALAALAGIAAIVEGLRVRRDLRRAAPGTAGERLELVEAHRMATGMRLRRRWRPLAAEPRWTWTAPPARVESPARGTHGEVVVPSTRAIETTIRRRVVVEDLFGLWRFRLHHVQPRPVLVVPHAGALRDADLATCLASGDLLSHPHGPAVGDRADFRTYARSDPARLILWKVYARTRQLLVRTPEPARTPDTRPLVFLVAGEHDDAAAGVARMLMESGVLGPGARFATDGTPEPVSDRDAVREAIALSSRHRRRGGTDLATTLASGDVEAGDPVVLVCAAAEGAWIRRAVHQVARDPDRFLVLAAGDGRDDPPARRALETLLFRPDPAMRDGSPVSAMHDACRPLAATGARVVLVDRRSGSLTRLSGPWSSDEALAAAAGAGA